MDVNDQNVSALVAYLEATLNPDPSIRRKAEHDLESVEANTGFSQLMCHVINLPSVAPHVRQAAAITFKNFVKRNWRIIDGETNRISPADRHFVKTTIVDLMLVGAEPVQKQLSQAVSIIGLEDFPEAWPELMPSMILRFKEGDFGVINGILQTANSLFKRYRHEMKSDKLWLEIKHVLEVFAGPLTELFVAAVGYSEANRANPQNIQQAYSVLIWIAKIFYSLNCQDLPEFFEDNIATWMPKFLELFKTEVPLLVTQDETDSGLLEQLRTQICDIVTLYGQRYEEEFQPFLPSFVEAIWTLLVSTGVQPKYDLLTCNAIKFLASICERPQYKALFENENALAQICERVIVPNMEFRESDHEMFTENADEFIRRDIEGSDVDTRRRAACDFVKSLCRHFELAVIQIFSEYVQTMLGLYNADQAANWTKKDAAVYLVTSLASKGSTAKHGVTQSSELVNLSDFFRLQILPDLQIPVTSKTAVLQADALKYLVTFRNQLGKENLLAAIPHCVTLLHSEQVVVHTYAAHAIERLLTVRNPSAAGGGALLTPAEFAPVIKPLITNIFWLLTSVEESAENEYAMKCLMRVLLLAQDSLEGMAEKLIAALTAKLVAVAKNPSKPHFNHYLFECICVLIRGVCKQHPAAVAIFEQALFPPFQNVLTQEVTEFMPYVFQILSMTLAMNKEGVSQPYMVLFPFLLNPPLWEKPGNIQGLVGLLQSFIMIGPSQITEGNHISAILGIFQKLIASKANDHYGFNLVNAMVEHLPLKSLESSIPGVFTLLFRRLQSSKTTKFVKNLIVFLCLYAIKASPHALVAVVDAIQANLFGMVLEKVVIADLQKVSGSMERKICSVGVAKLLCEAPELTFAGAYSHFWPGLLNALVSLHELPEEDAPDDEHFLEIEDTPGYSSAYSQLAFASQPELDPTGVPDAKLYLAKSLEKLSIGYPGQVMGKLSSLDQQAANFLKSYLNAAGVAVS